MDKNDRTHARSGDVTVKGVWWTAYGERFPSTSDERGMFLAPEQIVSVAGIHDPEARRRCLAALDAIGRPNTGHPEMFGIGRFALLRTLLAHGGKRPPEVGIPLPRAALGGVSAIGGLDGANLRWARHDSMMRVIHDNLDGHFRRDPERIVRVVTQQLEAWHEGTIVSLPQAVAYALSAHPEWRKAAATWLLPHKGTWLRDYRRREPHACALARLAAKSVPVPSWLLSKAA